MASRGAMLMKPCWEESCESNICALHALLRLLNADERLIIASGWLQGLSEPLVTASWGLRSQSWKKLELENPRGDYLVLTGRLSQESVAGGSGAPPEPPGPSGIAWPSHTHCLYSQESAVGPLVGRLPLGMRRSLSSCTRRTGRCQELR